MADSNSGGSSGASSAIVAIVAILAILVVVWFVFFRGGVGGGTTDVDVNVDPSEAVETVTPE